VLIAVIVVGTLMVLGIGISAYFAYLTEGSEPNRNDALAPGRELCFEDYAPPRVHRQWRKVQKKARKKRSLDERLLV